MSGGGRPGASGDSGAATDDPDAPWKRTGQTAVVERVSRPRLARSVRRHRRTSPVDSPWSRESIESPLPSIDQIRARWRLELGLDGDDEVPPAGQPAAVAAPAPVDDRTAGAPGSTMSGDVVLTGLVVGIVVVAALAVAWALVPPELPRDVDAPVLPSGVVEQWTVDVGSDAALAFAPDVVVAAVNGEVRAIDGSDGSTSWTAGLDGGEPVAVQIYEDVVVTVEETSGTVVTLSGFDRDDGSLLWSRPAAFSSVSLDAAVPIEYSSPDGRTRLRMLDPATGSQTGPTADATETQAPYGHLIGLRDGMWSLLDLGAQRWIEPPVAGFGLRSIAPVGEFAIGLTDDSDIVLYHGDGVALDQRPFVSDAFGDFNGRAELVGGVPGTSIGIVASGSSVGVDVGEGSIEVVWEVAGRVGAPVDTRLGPIAVARVVDAASGEVDDVLVDATDGTTIAITDSGVTRESPPIVAADGYVVAPAVGDPTRTIRAFDFEGHERWSLELGRDGDHHVVDGVVYTSDADGNLAAHH